MAQVSNSEKAAIDGSTRKWLLELPASFASKLPDDYAILLIVRYGLNEWIEQLGLQEELANVRVSCVVDCTVTAKRLGIDGLSRARETVRNHVNRAIRHLMWQQMRWLQMDGERIFPEPLVTPMEVGLGGFSIPRPIGVARRSEAA